ncbi:type 4b pilus protein PilO2 [Pseudomonas simiae]
MAAQLRPKPRFKRGAGRSAHPAGITWSACSPPPPPPQWKQFELRYTTGITPIDSLSGAPSQGLRLSEIKADYKADHLEWSVIGDLYAK